MSRQKAEEAVSISDLLEMMLRLLSLDRDRDVTGLKYLCLTFCTLKSLCNEDMGTYNF